MEDTLIIILAAGMGTRMNSDKIKVLHKIAGKPMINYVLDEAYKISNKVVCVIGHQSDRVKKELSSYKKLNFVYQKDQLGTGHAVMQAKKYIEKHNGPVLILYGDTPLLRNETLESLINKHIKYSAGMTVLTSYLENPTGYGRIIKDEEGQLIDIVEEQDADLQIKRINEINTGLYCFSPNLLADALENLDNDNNQGEYYLPDVMEHIKNSNKIITESANSEEILGVNTREDLAAAAGIIRQRINNKHMENGVTLLDPESTYIEENVEIDKDVVIYPNTHIKSGTVIKKDVIIESNCFIEKSSISNHVKVKHGSVILESSIDKNTNIGPYAYLRPQTKIGSDCRIGNFVELKKSSVDDESKVPHLSYVGNATIGKKCNIGAGTIFANYDGVNKHETVLGDNVFIGSNTTLVAPVKLEDRAKTGAGSVVTRNVESDSIVLGVPARLYKKDS
ncbi:bifunctional UDP-N-acetylglucosamine diphosphorylase/glucosamine-1-phosphate N-acetyltransferase GlmU [Halanaerobiaceae bacterium Z-7014]|uniref:Bifunctional protein GlmU n=1 Tax=Halonatronomonas betaini TaxID=2778430 RepID=A0A931ARP2_9FIRM|nr:bifunctional UDP-N-acetylglucosamine diphosphorylase/glucosamine-1-phosphate N-acetyltransferase GlmU [Halonatronomonas betaini]MBF8437252.1 bifunctional UDP-N-acetylglucosamine diphosphorylase/glucosamine-1-phosphate N-acetyltransferase GlmU [Halonatronomonas betaini]